MSSKFNMDNFIKFLEQKPADETYSYGNSNDCALARFSREIDHEYHPVSWGDKTEAGRMELASMQSPVSSDFSRTYGGALKEAKEIRVLENA